MKALPLRTRLTVWYFALLAASLFVFAAFAFVGMRRSIYITVDEQLEDRVTAVQQLLQGIKEEDFGPDLREHSELQSEAELLQISDGSGRFIYRSREMRRFGVRRIEPQSEQVSTSSFGGVPLRVLSRKVSVHGQNYIVQVAAPMDDFFDALNRFRSVMLVAIPIILLVTTGGGYWISSRALSPVDQITREAQNIGAHDLSRRLIVPVTGDELQRLSETLNGMLQRLEMAFQRVSQFTADASHELRTPLALMRTRAEITLRKPRKDIEYHKALQQILVELEETSVLVENLLFLARADTGVTALTTHRIDLAEVMRDVCPQGRTLAQAKEIFWVDRVSKSPVWINGNSDLLRRLFLILIDNAVKYSPPNSTIEFSLSLADHLAKISVRDSGIGISELDLSHIFERFYRADKARSRESGGVGLGLSIGKWITEAHGGSIEVQSSAGTGSTFLVCLPLMMDPPQTKNLLV